MNLEAISKMKHAIGFRAQLVERGQYNAYRNFYDTGKRQDQDREELIDEGYAICDIEKGGVFDGYHFYRVTDKGARMLSELTGIKIVL